MNILTPNQFGFRQNSSTSDAVLEALDNVYSSLDKKETVIAVFLDFSKAFDTVNHNILLSKLMNLGIRGRMNDWFSSYLSARKQCVVIDNISSEHKSISMGVPQGSILGPILFLLYINDMSRSAPNLKFVHFTDDTIIFTTSTHFVSTVENMNNGLKTVDEWLKTNRLSLNISKTLYMIFSDLKHLPHKEIKIREEPISKVSEAKFLGIYIDEKLSFKSHIDHLRTKLAQAIGTIRRISYLLPVSTRMNLYYSLIYSHMAYGILAWGKCGTYSRDRIVSLQNRSLRILNLNFNTHKILNFNSIYEYLALVKLFKIQNLRNHDYYYQKLMLLIPQHNQQTRSLTFKNFNTPFFNKSKSQKSFIYQAINAWNNFELQIKDSNSLPIFKNGAKNKLLIAQNNQQT